MHLRSPSLQLLQLRTAAADAGNHAQCTAGQWQAYMQLPKEERQPLMNVVSLSLAGTPLKVRGLSGAHAHAQ